MPMLQVTDVDKQYYILGMKLNVSNYEYVTQLVIKWAKARQSRYICLANVHMVMEAYDSAKFRQLVNAADLVTPDGKPLSWSLQALGVINQQQVCGRELTLHICKAAAFSRTPVGFYGSSKEVLKALITKMQQRYPNLNIAYAYSPPYYPLTLEEKNIVIEEIKASGTRILFVGLGCPKQEHWMAQHKNQIPAVMLGIGAAFDVLAGAKPQVPSWMQDLGLEWLFRLCLEPRRLWYRNFRHSPRFVMFFALEIFKLLLLSLCIVEPEFNLKSKELALEIMQYEKVYIHKSKAVKLLTKNYKN